MTVPALSNALARLRTTLRDLLFVRERYGVRPTPMAEDLALRLGRRPGSDRRGGSWPAGLRSGPGDPDVHLGFHRLRRVRAGSEIVARCARGRCGSCCARRRSAPTWPRRRDVGHDGDGAGPAGRSAGQSGRAASDRTTAWPAWCGPITRRSATRFRASSTSGSSTSTWLPPGGRLRAGLFQALEQQGLKREVAVSVTHFLAVPEMVAATDYCATLPALICRRLTRDPRLKVVPAPVDLGTFPVQMGWHVPLSPRPGSPLAAVPGRGGGGVLDLKRSPIPPSPTWPGSAAGRRPRPSPRPRGRPAAGSGPT